MEKEEAERLLLGQVDLAKEKQTLLKGTPERINATLGRAIKAGYGHIHPAWAIPLFLSRN